MSMPLGRHRGAGTVRLGVRLSPEAPAWNPSAAPGWTVVASRDHSTWHAGHPDHVPGRVHRGDPVLSARAIEGVPTSTTAFIGGSVRGPTDRPRLVTSFTDFERVFGGLSATFSMGHAVRLFFENGGRRALICRVRGWRRGARPTNTEIVDRGVPMLDRARERVNIVAIPPLGPDDDVSRQTWNAAAAWAKRNRAMLIVDPPAGWQSAADVTAAAVDGLIAQSDDLTNAALYFPWLLAPDPLAGNRPAAFAPSGAICGIYARTDVNRGVWKAPAGADGGVQGATGLAIELTKAETDNLNPRGINTIRTFPGERNRRLGRANVARRGRSWPRTGSTYRSGGSRCSSKDRSTRARNGPSSSPTTSRCGPSWPPTSATSCTRSSAMARSRATVRRRRSSCAAIERR